MLWIVGSLNFDLTLEVDASPLAGETLPVRTSRRGAGGKGANQAAAAARMGAEVALIGAIGDDPAGQELVQALSGAGVDLSGVIHLPNETTGTAVVIVEPAGENRILIAAGANGLLTPERVQAAAQTLPKATLIASVLEVPFEAVETALSLAHRLHVPFLLNAAPALPFPLARLSSDDILLVNGREARTYLGPDAPADGPSLATAWAQKGQFRTIVTLGEDGCVIATPGAAPQAVAAPKVEAVDTTGAGDAFCGVFAARLLAGQSLLHAVQWACAAGALTATRPGAQTALPERNDVAALVWRTYGVTGDDPQPELSRSRPPQAR